MKVLTALWSLAALLEIAGGASAWTYGAMLASRIGVVSIADDKSWQLLEVFYTAAGGLLGAGLLVALIALSTHAIFWARAADTPSAPPRRSSRSAPSP